MARSLASSRPLMETDAIEVNMVGAPRYERPYRFVHCTRRPAPTPPLGSGGVRGRSALTRLQQSLDGFDDHLLVALAELRIRQVALENRTEGVPVRDPKETERADQQMHVHRLEIGAEHALLPAALQDRRQG